MSEKPARLLLVHGHDSPRPDIREALAKRYSFLECGLSDLRHFSWESPLEIVIDAPLNQSEEIARIREALTPRPQHDPGLIFVIDHLERALMVRAHALGAEGLVPRPINTWTLFSAIDIVLNRARARTWRSEFGPSAEGLDALFVFASAGTKLTQHELYDRGDTVIDALAETGIGNWVEAVKAHHSRTYRHSLLVTGIAVSFGQSLGMRRDDLRRLSLGGLLHDIGKASIPIELLEKPGILTPDETLIVRQHPVLGRAILKRQGGFAPEMIDVVAHHHEFLDGSGYPEGLDSSTISDLVRIVTIADIFAAMIEERSYKHSFSNMDAYALIRSMKGKLDWPLVEAFRPIALETRLAA